MSQDKSISEILKDKKFATNLLRWVVDKKIDRLLAGSSNIYYRDAAKELEDIYNKYPRLLVVEAEMGRTKKQVIQRHLNKYTGYVKK